MNKKFLNYTDWQGTADTLHMYLQMLGKVKLMRCHQRPEWAHVRFYLTVEGVSTGIIPGDNSPFEIQANFMKHLVVFRNGNGKVVTFTLQDGLSVMEFYKQFMKGLEEIGSPTAINVRAQEFYDPIDFDKDTKHHHYDKEAVKLWHQNHLFAYEALRGFLSGFRGKVDGPAYYFGTMDLTGIVYSGESAPFGMNKPISDHAFDERYFECGFWPGDVNYPRPAFYGLPYPFISDIKGNDHLIRPAMAIFKPEKKEFFLTLEDALAYDDPFDAVHQFLQSSFDIMQKVRPWQHLNWITTPLTYSK